MIPKSSQRWFLSKDEIQQRVSDPFLNNDMEGLRFLVQLFSVGVSIKTTKIYNHNKPDNFAGSILFVDIITLTTLHFGENAFIGTSKTVGGTCY